MKPAQSIPDTEYKRPGEQRQAELYARSRQEGGPWDGFDWQAPGATLPGRFSDLAARYPDRTAAYDSAVSYTYGELDEASNRLANALLARRGPTNEIVALMLSRGTASPIAALGVMKAGKAYVGFDDVYPEARSAAVLADAGCNLIVCDYANAALAQRLAGDERQIIRLDQTGGESADSPNVTLSPDDLAVLTYSSGTTGRPKGVFQTHFTALAQTARLAKLECYGPNDRVATFGTAASGSHFLKMFAAFCAGACMASFNIRRWGPASLLDWLDETGVTAAGSRAILRQLYDIAGDRQLPQMRTLTLGGDTIYRRDIEACRRLFPNALASVGLGMTEAGRVSEWLIDATMPLDEDVTPSGFAVPGVALLILDETGEPAAPGEVGEIAVRSQYLARGYWKQPELTAERFLQDGRYGPGTLYLTGDMGSIDAGGMLRHLGRKDYLVKIRGFFVPTNEVEGLLLSQPGIVEATVVKHLEGADGGTLVAYVVANGDHEQTADGLQAILSARLPVHMVPQRIIFMDALPHNARGKVDRSRLPAPGRDRPSLTIRYVAPSSPLEKQVVALWSELLSLDRVGMDDAFLALGGDSLQAMRLVNRVNDAFDIDLPASLLLSAGTAGEMVTVLRQHLLAPRAPTS